MVDPPLPLVLREEHHPQLIGNLTLIFILFCPSHLFLNSLVILVVGQEEGQWEIFVLFRSLLAEVVLDIGLNKDMQQFLGPFLKSLQPILTDSFLLAFSLGLDGMLGIMQFLLALIEDIESIIFEINQESLLHFVGDLV
jgi:hypothetical protein